MLINFNLEDPSYCVWHITVKNKRDNIEQKC